MKAVLCGLILVTLTSGCAVTSEHQGIETLIRVDDIGQLVGCYVNKAPREGSQTADYLSRVIWPKDEDGVSHEHITAIRVTREGPNALRVTGEDHGVTLRQGVFVQGEHFSLRDGSLLLKSELIGSAARQPGNVVIGLGHEAVRLGLDAKGDGYMRHDTRLVGTAFLIIPVAADVSERVRFRRLSDDCR